MKKTIISVFVIALALTFVTPVPAEAKEEFTQSCSTEKSKTTTKSRGYRSKSKATTKNKGYRAKSKATTTSKGYRAKSKAPAGTSKSKSSKKTYDPYDADNYTSADDFAEDKYEEFYDYEDDAEDDDDAYDAAVDYWNSKNNKRK